MVNVTQSLQFCRRQPSRESSLESKQGPEFRQLKVHTFMNASLVNPDTRNKPKTSQAGSSQSRPSRLKAQKVRQSHDSRRGVGPQVSFPVRGTRINDFHEVHHSMTFGSSMHASSLEHPGPKEAMTAHNQVMNIQVLVHQPQATSPDRHRSRARESAMKSKPSYRLDRGESPSLEAQRGRQVFSMKDVVRFSNTNFMKADQLASVHHAAKPLRQSHFSPVPLTTIPHKRQQASKLYQNYSNQHVTFSR